MWCVTGRGDLELMQRPPPPPPLSLTNYSSASAGGAPRTQSAPPLTQPPPSPAGWPVLFVDESGSQAARRECFPFACSACGATSTPQTRSGPSGPGTLCNRYILLSHSYLSACRHTVCVRAYAHTDAQGFPARDLDLRRRRRNTRVIWLSLRDPTVARLVASRQQTVSAST